MRRVKFLASASLFSIVLVPSAAFAAGTTAGSSVLNTATVNYQVGGVAQSAASASASFTVDRKISLTVAEATPTGTTSVAPGSTNQVTTFTVTNTSNAVLDLGLAVAQPVGGTAAHGGTDAFDVTAVALYVDTNANGVYDAGTDTAVTYLDEVAADATKTVFVVASVPASATNSQVAGVTLTAQARDGGGTGSQGIVSVQTAGANTAGTDTVFADTAGATDAARDGQHSARDDYTVAGALLTTTKIARVVQDPQNGTTNPKLIPGATVEYCITVNNAAGGATATNVAITDPLPGQATYDSTYGIFLNGTVTGGVCNLDGTSGGSFTAGTVSGTLSSIPANTTRTLYFRATIN